MCQTVAEIVIVAQNKQNSQKHNVFRSCFGIFLSVLEIYLLPSMLKFDGTIFYCKKRFIISERFLSITFYENKRLSILKAYIDAYITTNI